MNNAKLERIIQKACDKVTGESGVYEIDYKGRFMLIITDEAANRMRIISPIKEAKSLSHEEVNDALVANFHTALDVKYAISEGVMWSVFIHPLAELYEPQLIDALSQVYQSVETFGTTYSSTDLIFPGSELEGTPARPDTATRKM